jgi:hippurate hydrolase
MSEIEGLVPRIEQLAETMAAWRQDIHAHPELGFEEQRTAYLVAERLESFGCEVVRGIGQTGVVGTLRAGSSGRSVGLRADMDALPIQETNDLPHRSRHEGRMHACGHDGHTAMLLGAAQYLAETRDFDGIIHFIFQPAEEGLGGARAMLADGLFERFPCEAVFSMHNRPGLPVGKFGGARAGALMAAGAFFDIEITGKGAHGAYPETGIDAVVVAAQMVTALQTVISRNMRASDAAVLSVTKIHAGDAYNVIPQTARLSGTVRAFSREVVERIEQRMREIATGVAQSMGATAELGFRLVFAPTVNAAQPAEFAANVCARIVGNDNVERDTPATMGSEDFSFMLEAVPGCYIHVGNGPSRPIHNPGYEFNDAALPYGASFYARVAEGWLNQERRSDG